MYISRLFVDVGKNVEQRDGETERARDSESKTECRSKVAGCWM